MKLTGLWIVISVAVLALTEFTQAFVPITASKLKATSTAWAAKQIRGLPRRRPSSSQGRRACAVQMHKVTVVHQGETHVFEVDESTSILDAALDNNVELPHDCKLGVCLTCPSKIESGEIDQSDGTLDASVVEKGFALTCCSYARSDVTIRSIEEDELVGAQFSDRT